VDATDLSEILVSIHKTTQQYKPDPYFDN